MWGGKGKSSKEDLEEAQQRLLSYVRRVGRYVQVEKQLKTCQEILSRAVEKKLQLIESAEQKSERYIGHGLAKLPKKLMHFVLRLGNT